MISVLSKRWRASIVLLTICGVTLLPADQALSLTPSLHSVAADFTLPDLNGQQESLSGFSGKPVVLFFFCGCRQCHDAARSFALAERKRAYPTDGPRVVIVYTGNAADGRRFLKQTGLVSKDTDVMLDTSMAVTALYNAELCPRAFVLSPAQQVVYTNTLTGTIAYSGDALAAHVETAIKSIGSTNVTSDADRPRVAPPPTSPVYLTPLADDHAASVSSGGESPGLGSYDFGNVKLSETQTIKHIFKFRNDTASTIVIDHLQPSCGCTNAFINDTADFPVSVSPGETMTVTAFVDLTDLIPAPVEKSVMIFRQGQISPVATLEITGNLIADR